MLIYRPIGLKELQLVYESGMRAWPPRLPEQPIFYPVLNYNYAEQIAREWNTKSNFFAGYITEFSVEDTFISHFERHIVGAREHEELWIPAEQLEEFNRHIVGRIKVSGAYFGQNFQGYISDNGAIQGRNAVDQFILLTSSRGYSLMDFHLEIKTNNLAVFLHYPFWKQYDFSENGISQFEQDRVLEDIQKVWVLDFPEIHLPTLSQGNNKGAE